ncbi:MAG: PilC/PilY family type IV pilus protein [Gammaproteobacteria bacterium]|nr:PilC/PilY family type IV pilus protein [Gammaproteobacteria bacterium]
MNSINIKRSLSLLIGTSWAVLSGLPALADDTELFVTDPSLLANSQPNILFIIDTSGSMDNMVTTQPSYDPTVIYGGACDVNRIYWRTDTGDPPSCATDRWFDVSAFTCNAAKVAFANGTGRYTDRMAQFDDVTDDRWESIDSAEKSRWVECEDDAGLHGQATGDAEIYPRNGDPNILWTASSNQSISWGQTPTDRLYTAYQGNYINWFFGPTTTAMRIDVVKDVSTDLLSSVNGVNVGLMRFNYEEGGPVIHAMEDIDTARAPMTTTINNLPYPDGYTPLSETLYEAGLYYMGGLEDYGDVNDPASSVAASKEPSNLARYNSPMDLACQKNFIVLLTDGAPTRDSSADSKIAALSGFSTATGNASCTGSGNGHCLDDMAAYMYESDLSPLPGKQNVVTYTIGFTTNLQILDETATRGGGAYFLADDTASLSTALTNIVTEILDSQTTFTSPAVSVNAFNRTRNLNELYITVFQASGDTHWPGNLKKYRLRASDGEILDADGNPAIDPSTGFFQANSRSFWSASPDGPEVVEGGAANQLPSPATRNVYTYLAGSLLTTAGNLVDDANTNIDNAVLGIGQPGDPTRDTLIDFIRGVDVADHDQDGDLTEPRNQIGDPLHAQPASVIYGGTTANPDINDAVVYFATNDGYLHAVDPLTGVEKWAFIPPEFLDDQVTLFHNNSSANKHYGIDGNLRIQMIADNDGVIDPGANEKVYLYFGMRRGGNFYYGMDITNPDAPQVMWSMDGADLPGVGQSWSTPVPTRIDISGVAQNPENAVLIFSGGYDTSQDQYASGTDNTGNALYIVDAVNGNLLWHASDAGADRNLAKMLYSIPSDVKVLDLDSDDLADRMYVGDMGGQLWRFDIHNGQGVADIVTGGVFAELGSAPNASPGTAESRRFYYAPDLALTSDEYSSFLHIGIGSGHRARPNSVFTQDRFYALRDYAPFTAFNQSYYDNTLVPITDAGLQDITDNASAVVPAGSPGWRFELRTGGWLGEKVLAEPRTFNNQVFFTTFTPGAGALSNGCLPSLGTNRLYIVDLLTGAPVNNLDNSADPDNLTETDRFINFRGSISDGVNFLFPSTDASTAADPNNCVGDECAPPPLACVGFFCFPPGFGNNPARTFWSEETTN